MKKYIKEIIILPSHLALFYLLPLTAGPTDMMGLVVLLILLTYVLSLVLGIISGNTIRFFYPVVIAVLFIPTVFIYYNESALVHAIWYLVDSALGLGTGALIRLLVKRR